MEILRDEDDYCLRDLGSTNGTFLNGRQIDEAHLSDGDLFVLADVELTFFAGRSSDVADMVTQAITFPENRGAEWEADREMGSAVRRLDEMLAHRAIVVRFEPIFELNGGDVFAYRAREAEFPCGDGRDSTLSILKTECRLSSRYRRLKRMLALEQSAELPERTALFLPLDEYEIGDEALGESFERLAEVLPSTRSLVAVVSQRDVSDVAYFRRLFDQLRSADFGLVKQVQDRSVSLMGGLTPVYAAPEIFDNRPSLHSH